jgi:hypothetical protein
VILRLIQGFAVGGEISGASAMIVEHAPFGRRGYYASFTLQGVQAGQIIAAAVILPLSALLSDERLRVLGLADPVPAERRRRDRRLRSSGRGSTRPPRSRRRRPRRGAQGADRAGRPGERLGHAAGDLHGADERHPLATTVFGATYATNERTASR